MSLETLAQLVDAPPPKDATQSDPRVHAELLTIAQQPQSRGAFLRRALSAVAKSLNSPYAAAYVRFGSESLDDEVHFGPTDPAFWRSAVRDYLTESLSIGQPRGRLLSARGSDLKIAILSAPLYDAREGRPGAVALIVRCHDADLREPLLALESLATLISHLIAAPADRAEDASRGANASSLAKAAAFRSPTELAFSITNSLRTKLGCEQTALALVHHRHARIISISGLDDVNSRSPGVARIRGAMEECLDHAAPVVAQHDESSGEHRVSTGHRLHKQWHESAGGAAVASIPLRDGGEIVAALSLRRRADEPFTADQIALVQKLVEPLAPAFGLLRRSSRSLLRHAADVMFEQVALLGRPGHVTRRLVAAMGVIILAWMIFGTMDYALTVPCSTTPKDARVVAAPIDGRVKRTLVQPGDHVAAGAVLLEIDQREMELSKATSQAQIRVLEQERWKADAAGDPVAAALAAASLELERARLAQTEQRLDACLVRAPLTGVVVAGDLRRRVGAPLTRGEELFQIAPAGAMRVELSIPQYAASWKLEGLEGRFAGHARPEQAQVIRVVTLRPNAEVRGQSTVFVAECEIVAGAEWIRAGMEGTARVSCGRKPVWWTLFHRAVDYLHEHWWL